MERVANLWKAVDWESVQARVDAEIKAIEDREICAEEGRRILLDESNKYRQNTDKEQRRIAVPLIKTFQKEVDQLTTRGKTAEAALISLCQRLTELPDPTPYIEQAAEKQKAVDRARIAEEERDELRDQIQQLSDEFSHLQNQDVTLRQLRERIKQLESEKETEVTESANQTEKALREEFALKEKEMSLKTEELRQENGILEKKVSELEVRMKDSQRRLDTARVEQQQKGVLESEQNELLNRDLNDANRRIISLESEVARLTSELVEAQANAPRTGIEDIAALGSLLKGKDEQIARVTEENRKIREKLQAEEAKSRERMAEMRKEVERYSHIVESLNAELAKKADYDQIQQELRILRQMEFGCTDDIEEAPQPSNTVASSLENTLKTLDQLLVDKSKKLQADNAQLRTANEQLTDSLSSFCAPSFLLYNEEEKPTIVKEEKLSNGIKNNTRKTKRSPTPTEADSQQILFNILMSSMGTATGAGTSNDEELQMNPESKPVIHEDDVNDVDQKSVEATIAQISQELGVKLSNYTGEPPKKPQEVKAINDLVAVISRNVRNLGQTALNTWEVARQCKRLMLAYNIGQRLFAKYVMNQSQGSLSELLSKPRPWSKLTDKGREAFRRIYAWVSCNEAISLLCQLSPRKMTGDDQQSVPHPKPDSLWECNSAKLGAGEGDENQQQQQQHTTPPKRREESSTGTTSTTRQHRNNSRWRHDDIPKEKIMTIFQNELAKLKEQETNLERAINSRGGQYSAAASLKRLEDLTFGGITQQGLPSKHAQQVMNERVRNGLQPITQTQFEAYGVVNTEEIVRQVKDFLTVNTISQRQFGEYVLGLSQGSVSDLLARPKSWHMLTQKGREPFIRMKLFMEDVAIAAEKAAEQDGSPAGSSARSMVSQSQSPGFLFNSEMNDEELNGGGCGSSATATVEAVTGDDVEILFMPVIKTEVDEDMCASMTCGLEDMTDQAGDASSLFANNAVPWDETVEELDTTALVRKVKDRLHLHGISQRLFGELILGISAGQTSELFLRPKRWSALNMKAREPYEKMIDWLTDKNGLARLVAFERAEIDQQRPAMVVSVKKRPSEDEMSFEPPPRKMQVGSKSRTVITDAQRDVLKFVFAHEQHPSHYTCDLLAARLGLHLRTVHNWFHNYRTRQKASLKEGKILPSQLPSVDPSRDWHKDLESLLENQEASLSNTGSVSSSRESPMKISDQDALLNQAVQRMMEAAGVGLTNLQSATGEVLQLKEDNGRLKDLVERLESDLTRASRPVAVVGALQSEASLGTLDALADCVSAGEVQQNTADGTSFAQIVAAQRDRLKQKLIIAEEERADEKSRNALLQSEVEKLREDNVKLFGKIRFLQSYGSGKSNEVRMDMTEGKYTEQYENRLDPFRKFNQTESMRGLNNLKVHERASLSIGRAILTSSSARLTFFAYLLVLHLLVFLVLYRFAYTEACERDFQQDCVERFQSHMKQHHPEHPDVPH